MAGSPEQEPQAVEATSTTKADATAKPAPTSPARSDKSSDSEGKPVREKLKETRIDAPGTTEAVPASDQTMNDVPNGSVKAVDNSTSGSDSERGRLRRKRSREDFENDDDVEKQPEKKPGHDKEERHHTRKRSRDVKDIANGPPFKPATSSVSRIEENDADEQMVSPAKDTAKASTLNADGLAEKSPKNKRTRDQVETAQDDSTEAPTANGKASSKSDEERDSKRLRDKDDPKSADVSESSSKIPPGSGFANTSAESPFAAMAAKPKAPSTSSPPQSLPQTSDDKFKASGFGSFASSEKSPFGGLKSPGSSSPFAAATSNKLSSFAGTAAPAASTAGGFSSLSGTTQSTFGGTTFGSSLGSGFGGLGGAKLASFGSPKDLTIKGLKSKQSTFGAPADPEKSDESGDDGDEDENVKESAEEEQKSSQPILSQQPHETGEEGEHTVWVGRAKLYTMSGEGSSKAWKERGVGNFKLNVTLEEPKKARFVLRADGTHRLLLNTAVTKQLVFGGDSTGAKPKDGRLLFNSPTLSGDLEMHLLKLKAERAVELWEEVARVQETDL